MVAEGRAACCFDLGILSKLKDGETWPHVYCENLGGDDMPVGTTRAWLLCVTCNRCCGHCIGIDTTNWRFQDLCIRFSEPPW